MLDASLKVGLKEKDFWSMTIGELERELKASAWRQEQRKKSEAIRDYTLAALLLGGFGGKFPAIEEIYPIMRETEEVQQAKAQLQADKFIAFANAMIMKEQNNG